MASPGPRGDSRPRLASGLSPAQALWAQPNPSPGRLTRPAGPEAPACRRHGVGLPVRAFGPGELALQADPGGEEFRERGHGCPLRGLKVLGLPEDLVCIQARPSHVATPHPSLARSRRHDLPIPFIRNRLPQPGEHPQAAVAARTCPSHGAKPPLKHRTLLTAVLLHLRRQTLLAFGQRPANCTHHHPERAPPPFHRAAGHGSAYALYVMVGMRVEAGGLEEAEALARQAADHGDAEVPALPSPDTTGAHLALAEGPGPGRDTKATMALVTAGSARAPCTAARNVAVAIGPGHPLPTGAYINNANLADRYSELPSF